MYRVPRIAWETAVFNLVGLRQDEKNSIVRPFVWPSFFLCVCLATSFCRFPSSQGNCRSRRWQNEEQVPEVWSCGRSKISRIGSRVLHYDLIEKNQENFVSHPDKIWNKIAGYVPGFFEWLTEEENIIITFWSIPWSQLLMCTQSIQINNHSHEHWHCIKISIFTLLLLKFKPTTNEFFPLAEMHLARNVIS